MVTGSHTYTHNGKDTIVVDVTEDAADGQATANASATSTASIGLAPGTAANFDIAEGTPIAAGTQTATFTDSNLADTAADFTAHINWGDGTTTFGTISGANGSFTVSGGPHTYADEIDGGLITTTLTDNSTSDTASVSGFLTVSDADSFVVTGDNISGNPGKAFNGVQVATFTDAFTGQLAGDLTATIAWGDGTSSTGTISGGGGQFTVTGSHTYTTGGNDTLTVTVADDPPGTATASASGSAAINFAGHFLLTSATEHTALANSTIATFTDNTPGDTAGDFTATIDWGDGTPATAGTVVGSNGAFTVQGAHAYADEGNDQASVTLTHTADQSQTMFSGTVAVAENDALASQGGGAALHSGQASIAANFSDADTAALAGDLIGTINWGDGTTTTGTVSGDNGAFTVSGSHTYASSAAFVATVTLADDAPGTASSSQTVHVNPAPPAGTSADLINFRSSTGDYAIYDFVHNAAPAAFLLTNIGLPWQTVGLGNFSGSGTSDMLLRNMTTGSFEIVDVSNNNASTPILLGNVGLQVQVAGFGDFSSNPGETDMLMRDTRNGDFELYDFRNNGVPFATALGNVGLQVQVFGFGDFSGKPNETDLLMRDTRNDNVELVEFGNNQVTSVTQLGNLGSEWQFAGAGDFSSRPGETDLLARNVNNGDFELYDFQNGQVTAAIALGNIAPGLAVVGFADFSGNPNETDMLMRDMSTGNFTLVDFANNAVSAVIPLGNVGL
ncbi:MAG TPA: hypothetical protein VJ783_09485, partial [Pirellulales bacterium]|nr:hypothetical protein [Pirellulales bacterium]